jgi:hypothetical protein
MNNTLFIFVSYNHNYLRTSIPQFQKIYPDGKICIVNNNKQTILNKENVKNLTNKNIDNIFILNNEKNNYELGAFLLAYKIYNNYNRYIFLHNRSFIIKKLPDYIFEQDFVPFWIAPSHNFSPAVEWVEKKLKEYNIKLKKEIWDVCQGCSCAIKNTLLKKYSEKFNKIYAINKSEAVGTEVIFSFLLKYELNVYLKNPLNKHKLCEYIKKQKKYEYISYFGNSQSTVNEKTIQFPNKFNDINNIFDNSKRYTKNDILIELLLYTKKNEELENFLLNTNYCNYYCPNIILDIRIILKTLRHLLFSKKYFCDFYDKHVKKIISKDDIIFT